MEQAGSEMISGGELLWLVIAVGLTLLFSVATGFYRSNMTRHRWIARILASIGCSVTASVGVRWYYESSKEELNANVLMLVALGVGLFFDNIWAARELIWDKLIAPRLGIREPKDEDLEDSNGDKEESEVPANALHLKRVDGDGKKPH